MSRSVQYVLSLVILAVVAGGLVLLLRVQRAPGRRDGNQLVVLSPHPDSVQSEFFDAFREHYKKQTGEDCTVVPKDVGGGTQSQRQHIVELFKKHPDGIGIDIFWGGGPDPYVDLKKKKLLHAYKLPEDLLKRIPPTCTGQPVYDPQYEWYGAALSGFGILYNKKYQTQAKLPVPETWEDLAKAAAFGKVALADPRKSGVAHTLCEIAIQAYGWEKGFAVLTKMAGNCKKIVDSSSQVPAAVSLGEVIYGPTIDFYAKYQIKLDGADALAFLMPKGLTVINADGMGILKGAPNLELAEAFLRFVLSEDGQKLWILPVGVPGGPKKHAIDRITVIPDLYEKYAKECISPVDPAALKEGMDYDSAKAAARQAILNDLLGALLVDTHDHLVQAWQAVAEGKVKDPKRIKDFLALPIGEAEFMKLAQEKWQDEGFRSATITEWVKFAERKYKATASK